MFPENKFKFFNYVLKISIHFFIHFNSFLTLKNCVNRSRGSLHILKWNKARTSWQLVSIKIWLPTLITQPLKCPPPSFLPPSSPTATLQAILVNLKVEHKRNLSELATPANVRCYVVFLPRFPIYRCFPYFLDVILYYFIEVLWPATFTL